jgi:very-short-patch-repair endonuclease
MKQLVIDGHLIKSKYKKMPAKPWLTAYARSLRKADNFSEVIFWSFVRKARFYGLRFRRQKVIGNFIVDFYCPALQLVIEVDGSIHEQREFEDRRREEYLKSVGCKIIRFGIPQVLDHPDQVKERLKDFIIEEYGGW